MRDDPPEGIYELRPTEAAQPSPRHTVVTMADTAATFSDSVESVVIRGNDQTLALRSIHPDVLMAKARSRSVSGLLWIIGVTIAVGLVGLIVLSATGHPAEAVREVAQTAITAEVAVLASSLGRSSGA